MNLTSQKRIAASIMKCGVTRVKIKESKEVEEAITREDIRGLIKQGLITKIQKKGTSRGKARIILKQKKRGRRRGPGSKKGHEKGGKELWMKAIRAQRKVLKELRDSGRMTKRNYGVIYLRAKGGMFRNKKHLLSYLKEREMIKSVKKTSPKPKEKKL
jgi:large subunit ribosomal protein L19e